MPDRFTIVKKGYDPTEVNKYIENLELVIKGYKEKDAAINNALISAQVTAGSIIREATENAETMKADVVAKLDAVTGSIATQKRLVKDFQDDYNRLVNKYLREVKENELQDLYSRVNELEEYISGLSMDKPAE